MKTINKQRNIESILSEADELLNKYNSLLIEDMEEAKRTQIEIYANELKKLRFKVQDKTEKDKTPDYGSSGEGIHEAIDEIVRAMKNLTSDLI
jgi:ribosomal protein S17E